MISTSECPSRTVARHSDAQAKDVNLCLSAKHRIPDYCGSLLLYTFTRNYFMFYDFNINSTLTTIYGIGFRHLQLLLRIVRH
jgi:hypothetical protein